MLSPDEPTQDEGASRKRSHSPDSPELDEFGRERHRKERSASRSPSPEPAPKADVARDSASRREQKRAHGAPDRDDWRSGRRRDSGVLSFKAWLKEQPGELADDDASKAQYAAYEAEKESEKQAALAESYFERRGNSAWLREQYDPHVLSAARKERLESARAGVAQFVEGFSADAASWPSWAHDPADMNTTEERSRQAQQQDEVRGRTLHVEALPHEMTVQEFAEVVEGCQSRTLRYEELYAPPQLGAATLTRPAWVVFATRKEATDCQSELQGRRFGGEELSLSICHHKKWPPTAPLKLLPVAASAPARLEHDLAQATALMLALDERAAVEAGGEADGKAKEGQEKNPLPSMLAASEAEAVAKLDLVLGYLQEVHLFCYYTCEELWCPWQAKRLPVAAAGAGAAAGGARGGQLVQLVREAQWASTLDGKVQARLASLGAEQARAAELAGMVAEFEAKVAEPLKAFYDENTEKLEEGRYRCRLPPNKMFQAPEFIMKHIKLKHSDKVNAIRKKASKNMCKVCYHADPERKAPELESRRGAAAGNRGARGGRGWGGGGRGGRGGGGWDGGGRNYGGRGGGFGGTAPPRQAPAARKPIKTYSDVQKPAVSRPVVDFSDPSSLY